MASDTTEVLMPLMGEGITEATLVKWLKKPGEHVRKDEALLEVSTDKVDTEIPSPAGGTLLAVFAADGETVAVNKVVAHIGVAAGGAAGQGAGGAASVATVAGAAASHGAGIAVDAAAQGFGKAAVAARQQAAAVGTLDHGQGTSTTAAAGGGSTGTTAAAGGGSAGTTAAGAPAQSGDPRRSSPLVRKMAKAERIDLAQIAGTGLHGRITKRDIEAYQAAPKTAATSLATAATLDTAPQPAARLATKLDGGKETLEGVVVRREKMSRMRSLIAEHMVRSVRTSPHVTTVFEIDMHRVVKLREKAKAAFASREGFNLTFTPFFVYAAVQAIKRYPVVNVSVDGDDILWKDSINIGVAVAIESGLIVPVIRNAGELNVLGIARRLNDLATRARSKKLVPDDVQGGTFSITNPGMFGSIVSTPIINQPQVAILSIGAIVKRPVVIDDLIGIRPLVQIGLTFDHRVVDGEGGARYLAALKEGLEAFPDSEL